MEVTYIDHMGDDLRVANAARVSFAKESDWEVPDWDGFGPKDSHIDKQLSERDQKIIAFLARENHWTPFSHCMITMREKVPIFVARQRFKHMVGFTYNEVSRRYVDDPPEFFTPDVWRERAENKKQGSSDQEIKWLELDEHEIWDDPTSPKMTMDINEAYNSLIECAEMVYSTMIKSGVAPEQARMVLPQSMYTEYYVSGSLAAWARAYKLRIDAHAQKEIQDVAKEWDKIIRPLFPVSWATLVD